MIKQVIVIRKNLNMRKGKMCAQAAHASMKVIIDDIHIISKSYIGYVSNQEKSEELISLQFLPLPILG